MCVTLLSSNALADRQEVHDEILNTCMSAKGVTQSGLTLCARDALGRADAELNRIYRDLVDRASEDPNNAAKKLRAAQRLWIQYRDASVEAMFPAAEKMVEYGSRYHMDVYLMKCSLTLSQIGVLRAMSEEYRARE